MTSGTTANRGANSPDWYLAPLHPAMLARLLSQRGTSRGGRRGCNVLVSCEMPATVEAGGAAYFAAQDASTGGERCREGA